MPKLYTYFGLVVSFFANEHELFHVHGGYQNCEMKAEFILENGTVVEITKAEYVDGLRIHLWFNDHSERIIDFAPFLCGAHHPLFKKYRDVNEFKSFRIVHGNLDWNDFEMCFPIADLYKGTI